MSPTTPNRIAKRAQGAERAASDKLDALVRWIVGAEMAATSHELRCGIAPWKTPIRIHFDTGASGRRIWNPWGMQDPNKGLTDKHEKIKHSTYEVVSDIGVKIVNPLCESSSFGGLASLLRSAADSITEQAGGPD